MKKCTIDIKFCNSSCPNFYHKFEDFENIYCGKLDKKIFDSDDGDAWFDHEKRPIPDCCPLEDA